MSRRLQSPAWPRNRGPIRSAVRELLAGCDSLLEVASGPGQHAFDHADTLGEETGFTVQPTDKDPEAVASIDAWRELMQDERVLPAKRLDVDAEGTWPSGPFGGVIAVNFLHMVSPETCGRFFELCSRALGPGGRVMVYDCFTYEGTHVAESNAAFDQRLRPKGGGVHAIEDMDERAAAAGLSEREVRWLPANNQAVRWTRR